MDGPHDLGGRQGFGRIEVDEKEEPFHADWEARLYGLVRTMSRPADWSIDWFRHCRELIHPVDYLTRPYYDQWLQAHAAMLVNSGVATVEEIVSGKAKTPAPPDLPPPMNRTEAYDKARNFAPDSQRESDTAPTFAPGDAVLVRAMGSPGHTRLPAYVRGRPGVIEAYRGAHVFPDASAHGAARAEPLYTVGFRSCDLWPEAKDSRDKVFVDLWESYLERN
jgi:nitrile hydratase